MDLEAPGKPKAPPFPWAPGRVIATLPGHQLLDSLKVEAGGKVCVGTILNGGITIFDPTERPSMWRFPELAITNLCFGGADMRDVWVTGSSSGRLYKTRWPTPRSEARLQWLRPEKSPARSRSSLARPAASGSQPSELFAREGAIVILSDIQDTQGEAAAKRIGGYYLHQNAAGEDEWIAVLKTIRERHGRLDILVNNAGMAIGGDITELSLTDWRRQQALNVEGVFLGIKYALPLMRENGGGAIVNVASTVALTGSETWSLTPPQRERSGA